MFILLWLERPGTRTKRKTEGARIPKNRTKTKRKKHTCGGGSRCWQEEQEKMKEQET